LARLQETPDIEVATEQLMAGALGGISIAYDASLRSRMTRRPLTGNAIRVDIVSHGKAAKKAAKGGDGIGYTALCLLKKIEAKKAAINDDCGSDGTASSRGPEGA
jgi:hypothetical protein